MNKNTLIALAGGFVGLVLVGALMKKKSANPDFLIENRKIAGKTYSIYRTPQNGYYAKSGDYYTLTYPSLGELTDYLHVTFYNPTTPAPTAESMGLKPSSDSITWWISGKNPQGNGWGFSQVLGKDYPQELVDAYIARGNTQVTATQIEDGQ